MMLYRTPNVTLPGEPGIEWHCAIEQRHNGRGLARRYYRWRVRGGMWQPLSDWKGHPPTGREFGAAFHKFRLHMLQAISNAA